MLCRQFQGLYFKICGQDMVLASANCNKLSVFGWNSIAIRAPAPTVTTGWRTIELHWRPCTGVSPTPLRLQNDQRELKSIFGHPGRSQGQLAKKASTRGHGAKGQWNQRIARKSSNKIDNMIDVSRASSTDGEYCPNGIFMSFPVVPTWWSSWLSWSSWSSTMRRSWTSLTPRDSWVSLKNRPKVDRITSLPFLRLFK